jgi:hypothetical protein
VESPSTLVHSIEVQAVICLSLERPTLEIVLPPFTNMPRSGIDFLVNDANEVHDLPYNIRGL